MKKSELKRFTICVPNDLFEWIDRRSSETRLPRSKFISEYLYHCWDVEKKQNETR
jgi:metal-responsive CopG/Arc/MetJ family transcriptional regulator